MYKIAKEFHFDACHMLDGHNKKCHNLHGHTYRLIVEISDELILAGSSADMVLDYGDLKAIVKEHIINHFDHAYLYNINNENECKIADLLIKMQRKVYSFPCRTTAEAMSKYIYDVLSKYLPITTITLFETPTSYCTYQRA